MGYQEIIPPERLEEFKKIGPNEVQAKLDAGLYSGNHKKDAILFIKLSEEVREATTIPWHEEWWGKLIIVVIAAIIIAVVLSWFGLGQEEPQRSILQ